MTYRAKLAAAALLLTACLAVEANAQNIGTLPVPAPWTSADGGLQFAAPAGWVRGDTSKTRDVVFAASKGDDASGVPGVHCKLTIKLVGPTQPGFTQAAMNARVQAGASAITMDDRRVATTGGIVTIDGFLSMTPHVLAVMKAYYVRNGNLYDAYMECGRTHPPGTLTKADLAIARQLFNSIKVTP